MLCPHTVTMPDGTKTVVDLNKLKKVRDKMNDRARRGQLPTLSEDHIVTLDSKGVASVKDSSKIKLLGYGDEFDIANDEYGTPWLWGSAYNTPGKERDIEELPFTSVEFMPNEDVISNIAFTKHKPVMDNGTITPYHWKRGTISDTGKPTIPLMAYSAESQTGAVVIYSVEQPMNPLDVLIAGLGETLGKLQALKTDEGTPAPVAKAAPVKSILPYSSLASGPMTAEDKVKHYERRAQLEALATVKKVNIDVELDAWKDQPEEAFNIHCASITNCYASVNAGGAKVNPLDTPNGNIGGTDIDLLQKGKAIMTRMAQAGKHTNIQDVMTQLRVNPNYNGE